MLSSNLQTGKLPFHVTRVCPTLPRPTDAKPSGFAPGPCHAHRGKIFEDAHKQWRAGLIGRRAGFHRALGGDPVEEAGRHDGLHPDTKPVHGYSSRNELVHVHRERAASRSCTTLWNGYCPCMSFLRDSLLKSPRQHRHERLAHARAAHARSLLLAQRPPAPTDHDYLHRHLQTQCHDLSAGLRYAAPLALILSFSWPCPCCAAAWAHSSEHTRA